MVIEVKVWHKERLVPARDHLDALRAGRPMSTRVVSNDVMSFRWVWWTWSMQGEGVVKTGRSLGER